MPSGGDTQEDETNHTIKKKKPLSLSFFTLFSLFSLFSFSLFSQGADDVPETPGIDERQRPAKTDCPTA